ncbi:MAG TPA: CaiB/BaiF CoA-transferase family protein [Pseudonocardiaceae bacterium]
MSGPLHGLRVIEMAGLAPAPFAATMLADLGADVIRVDRVTPGYDVLGIPGDPLRRSRRSIGLDVKSGQGADLLRALVDRADVFIEGFRPGVAERMGIGPRDCLARNPRLVYGRITGWGQTGPFAPVAGHDINYIGISGSLDPIGRAGERPVPPLNLVGDFGGGGLFLAMGILAALYERGTSGRGQVVDASMVDGSALLATQLHGMYAKGLWPNGRGENMLDGGAPFYDTYAAADGKFVAVGAIEERFWADLLNVLGLDPEALPSRADPANWPRIREILAERISSRTRDEWAALAEGTDACLTPVLSLGEAPDHSHNVARGTFVEVDGIRQAAPGPKFDRTPAAPPTAPSETGADTDDVLTEFGVGTEDIAKLRAAGVIA